MAQIYFDHAATSWPKPAGVREALDEYFGEGGGNPGRSGHRMSIAASRIVEQARDNLAELFNIENPGQIVFTKNATEALNIAIRGILQPGDHAITSSIEHNSVMRPLRYLEAQGVEVTVVQCDANGILDPDEVAQSIKPNTRLLVTLHGSNVMGTLLPIKELAALARSKGIPYLIDASQTAGAIPIDVKALGLDLLAFTGHKGLLGLTGTGGIYIREGLSVNTLMQGGTGSDSDKEIQPEFMPDIHESGTLNVAGLAGLAAGVRYLLKKGVGHVSAHEQSLVARFISGVNDISGITLYGPPEINQQCGVISFNLEGLISSEVGLLLDQKYTIMSRVGLHCAPGAHRTLGTLPTGTVRFSFGDSNTLEEVDTSLAALAEISAFVEKQSSKEKISHG